MRIGIPREVKDGEARVGATPRMVASLAAGQHEVLVEAGAGELSGHGDEDYRRAGAWTVPSAEEIWRCPLVIKVKELQRSEWRLLRSGTLIAGYQQLGRDPELLEAVLDRGVSCLAYEDVTLPDGSRPMLTPMSSIAGVMSAQIAAWALQRREGPLCGSGVLLQGVGDIPPAQVLILGDGVAGAAAARAFLQMGCSVIVLGLEPSLDTLRGRLGSTWSGRLKTAPSCPSALEAFLPGSDVVVGAIAVPGRLSPKLIPRPLLRTMRPGSVFIDIGIDMGGIAETSRLTKLSDPLYVEEGVLHYAVPNIPAQVPRTATQALCAATQPFLESLADLGLSKALRVVPGLAQGLLVHGGCVVSPGLAADAGRPCVPWNTLPDLKEMP